MAKPRWYSLLTYASLKDPRFDNLSDTQARREIASFKRSYWVKIVDADSLKAFRYKNPMLGWMTVIFIRKDLIDQTP